MHIKRLVAATASIASVALVAALYTTHAAKSSDHQDTYNLATRSNTSADITDVYVFPSPSNPNNVVFAMDVNPLISPGTGASHFFDPTVIWQFKIAHGATNYKEDQVIQIGAGPVSGNTQTMTLYGPAAPNEVGTVNTLVAESGSAPYNTTGGTTFANGAQFFAGPRTDPFVFDLFAFFTFLGDRNYGTHTSQSDPGPETAGPISNGDSASNIAALTPTYDKAALPTQASFNGFASGTMSTSTGGNGGALGSYACSTNPATDTLFLGPFDVLSLVVEVPKSLISGGIYNTSNIHVWATANSSTGS